MPGSFFDTNVLVYLASSNAAKADQAETIIAGGGAISVQVLNELTNVARRKMRLSWPDIQTFLSTLRGLVTVHPVTIGTHETGLVLSERYGFSTFRSSPRPFMPDVPRSGPRTCNTGWRSTKDCASSIHFSQVS
jgi:predicted nucleic acid-binding protein